jgi:hypothetical protein
MRSKRSFGPSVAGSAKESAPSAEAPVPGGATRVGGGRPLRPRSDFRPSPRRSGSSEFLWLIPYALAAVYFVFFLFRFAGNIGAIDWVSDYSSGFTLAETLARSGSGGHTVISTTGAWVPLWFGLLTAKLPLHRQLWEISPTLLFIATALTIGWSVGRVAGRRPAILSVLIVLVASPWALRFFMAAVAHNVVFPATALLGAYLIWLSQGRGRRRATTIAVPVLAAIVLGTCIASDFLLLITGVLPLALTAVAAGVHRNRRARLVSLSALGTLVGAAPVALITHAIMKGQGYSTVSTSPPIKLAALSSVPKHAQLMFEGLRELSNGYLGVSWPGTLHAEIGYACDGVMIAALATLIYAGLRGTVDFLRSRSVESDTQLARQLHILYWFVSALVVLGAFVFTTAPGVDGTKHESYYVTIIFSVAAIVPLLIPRGTVARWLIPVGASIVFVGSIVGLKRNYLQVTEPALAHYAAQITKLAEINHVRTGYAGYWDASSLTWNSHNRVIVRPLVQCSDSTAAPICPFNLMRVPAWYIPKQRHTFLLVDPGQLFVITLPPGLGTPIATYAVGPLQMYIYSYDIASRLGPLN